MKELKVQYFSDLHLEFNTNFNFEKTGDVLVLAGDICPMGNLLKSFLTFCCERYDLVLFVAGNHEYYGSTIDTTNVFIERLVEELPQLVFLNDGAFKYHDIYFIGSTLWSHIPASAKAIVLKEINDYRQISNFNIQKCNDLHQKAVKFINDQLDFANEHDLTPVVITHHAPLMKGTSSPQYDGNVRNVAFATDLIELLQKAKWWICGHTHYCTKIQCGKCTLLLNCRGYNDSEAEFNPEACITITF